jgi:hypothetical protein
MSLSLTEPLTEVNTRNFPGGKGRSASRLTALPPSMSLFSKEYVRASSS